MTKQEWRKLMGLERFEAKELELEDTGLRFPHGIDEAPSSRRFFLEEFFSISLYKFILKMREKAVGMTLPTCLGIDDNLDPYVVDLQKLPHMLVGGENGSGKSMLLQNMIFSHFFLSHPKSLKIICLDGTEGCFFNLQKAKIVNCVEGLENISKVFVDLQEEVVVRAKLLKTRNVKSVVDYNNSGANKTIPYIVVYFDEFQVFPLSKDKDKKDVYDEIVELAAKIRKYGIHLVLSTQTPYRKIVSGLLSANLVAKACLKMSTEDASQSVLGKGDYSGTLIPSAGNLIFKWGLEREELLTWEYADEQLTKIPKNVKNIGYDFRWKK